ncbi:type VI secretion system baseplate subunit TssF [Aquabacterium sp.]|uniref:type VI secretion system baseplate subunit TssF n=1 Tax=Aquabacterium sp. TaxID=1872578 RepID=UPI002BDC3AFD|nr:type VI secretion system baseplate subunit TssF [Aquabacterium sp.]HSW04166.1 type VI secretion system baseplate subunit TssF [Aquabacterium sp.]
MRELLPYFQRELSFLQTHKSEFAAAYPEIGGRLAAASDLIDDPHVDRLIQSFALLSSRIHKRLDDDFPLFTESLLEVLYPHYLRPFPACSIAQFDLGSSAAQMSKAQTVTRGTLLDSRAVRGVKCRFRTAYDVTLLPLRISAAGFRGAVQAPSGSVLPREASSVFSITFELQSSQTDWATLGVDALRICLNGETSMVHALREALSGQVLGTLVQGEAHSPWQAIHDARPTLVGFGENDALIDYDPRSHPAYRLLTEYFAFPAKFNFFDLPLPPAAQRPKTRQLTLHFPMSGIRAESETARQLELADAGCIVLGCTPVVNVFSQRADPIRVTHTGATYPVLPDGGRRAYGYEVYAIDKVFRVQQTPQGESIHAFRPFYSLQHQQLLRDGEQAGRYWYSQRSESMAERSPGYETEIAIVDIEFDPAAPQADTLSIDVRATNRDLPSQLSIGHAGGDLFLEGGSVAREIRLLRVPTHSHRFERGEGALWRLISHLSLNHLSLGGSGVDALQELLRLYDLPRSAINRRLVDGVVDITHQAASACLPGNPFPTFVRGTQVRLTLDEQAFTGHGLRLFAQVLDHFFGLYVQANSFTQLEVLSAQTKEVLISFPQRAGSGPLL